MNRRQFLFTASMGALGATIGLPACRDAAQKQPAEDLLEIPLPEMTIKELRDADCYLYLDQLAARDEVVTLAQPGMLDDHGGLHNPFKITWETAGLHAKPKVNIDTAKGEITYNGKAVIRWEGPGRKPKDHFTDECSPYIIGGAKEDLLNGMRPVPMTIPAIREHPLHYLHQYRRFEDYAWLDKIYAPDSKPELSKPPKAKKESYEYRQWAYDNAFRTLRHILDWAPSKEMSPPYDKHNNLLLAAMARLESAQGELPGPNAHVTNQYGYIGLFQQREDTSLAESPLVKKPYAKAKWKQCRWNGYRVDGEPIRSRQDFLGNVEAQILAQHYFFQKVEQRLATTIDKTTTHTASGLMAAAHLTGETAVRRLISRKQITRDGNGVGNAFYLRLFDRYPIYPYREMTRNDKGEIEGLEQEQNLTQKSWQERSTQKNNQEQKR